MSIIDFFLRKKYRWSFWIPTWSNINKDNYIDELEDWKPRLKCSHGDITMVGFWSQIYTHRTLQTCQLSHSGPRIIIKNISNDYCYNITLPWSSNVSSNVSLMTGLDISLLTMGNESAFEDHFKLGNQREGRRENCCDENVSSSRFASLEIEHEDRTDVSRVDDENSRGDRTFSVGRSGQSASGSLEVAVKVVTAGRRRRSSGSFQLRGTEGSLSRFYERLAVTRMECVTSWRALYIMSVSWRTRCWCV